jgi:hypothetical protein
LFVSPLFVGFSFLVVVVAPPPHVAQLEMMYTCTHASHDIQSSVTLFFFPTALFMSRYEEPTARNSSRGRADSLQDFESHRRGHGDSAYSLPHPLRVRVPYPCWRGPESGEVEPMIFAFP